ncbi:MAG: hypothetical protein ND895_15365 [Pyrinomonadaceae bacterium]|nr:hypothetical protein [Pyrinomonadaceae bacterium]
MKTSNKSINAMKGNSLIKALFGGLLVAAFSFASIATGAGPAQNKAKKAFADWKAAQEAVAAAKAKLTDAQKDLQNAMTAVAKSGGKATEAQETALAQARAAVAAAEAALREAEKQELAARVALENEIAELPDGPLKDQLKRERNFPSLVTANGLHTVRFDTPSGQLTVTLPDDVRAGDTISGTVIAELKGQTKEERSKNQSELSGLVIEIAGKRVEPFSGDPQKERESVIQQTFWIYHVAKPEIEPAQNSAATSIPLPISLVNSAGEKLAQTTIPGSNSPGSPDGRPETTFNIPPLGQTGRLIVITGPFDGNSSNTTLNASALRTTGQDSEKSNENVSSRFGLLAESPRRAVFSSPQNVTGPIQIRVSEGNKETTGTYRNVGVNLTAPKTKLLKGEQTKLTVEVSGLQGIKEPVPLTLDSRGVITMEGGTNQPLVIQPSKVGADGRYSTTRGITGVQTGDWTATATVVIDSTPRAAPKP